MSGVFDELIGESINGFFLANEDWTLIIRTVSGKYFRFDTENDCCNTVWYNHISGIQLVLGERGNGVFDLLKGATVLRTTDKGWGENREEEEYEVVQDGFWTIHTNRGDIDIEVRNSHNGYYGGSISYQDQVNWSDITDAREITEDF